MKHLFENPGEKIQKYAQVVFWIIFAVSCFAGLLLLISGLSVANYGYGGSAVLTGLLVLILGGVYAWITAIFMVAFGKMSTDLAEINAKIEKSEHLEVAEPAEEEKMDYWQYLKKLQNETEACKEIIKANEQVLNSIVPEKLEKLKSID